MARTISTVMFLILFSIGLSTNATGQEHSYDIKHYDLTIEPNFDTKTMLLKAGVAIANPELTRAFSFGLSDRYDLVTATSDVSKVMVERSPGYVTLVIEKPSTQLQLNLELSGVLGKSDDEDRDVIADSSLFLLWSDRFYPIDFDDWATVTTTLILPSHFQAVAPGRLMKTHRTKDRVEYVFRTSTPAVCFSVIADSRWIMTEQKVRFLYMQTFLYPESQRFAEQIFSTSYDIISSYSQTYCLYPFDQFTFVTISGINARRAFPGFVGYNPQYLEKEFATTGHDAHETALLWWDYTTRGSGPGAFQWTEGFGDHAEFLYEEARGKPIPGIFESFRDKYLSLPAEQDVLYYELRGNTPQEIIHGKYPWLMRLMRHSVGDKAFKKAVGLLFYRFRFHTFSMSEFISTLEEGCGQSLGWWREEWLERTGVPTISLRSEIARNNGEYQIVVLLKQQGNIYHLPIEIGIETSKGLRIEEVNVSQREMSFTFKSAEKPVNILLDPNGWILMRKIYDK
ncbi:MAG: hypothetical protein NTX17_01440 [Candidatus Eisenbacteria bacterium]|nr:hypothetical protein [Candidatus Eisenbacteria bacterium]